MKTFLNQIPKLLIILRFIIGFILLIDALDTLTNWLFVFLFTIAFLSDIFDGIIARRMNVSTDFLRKADSLVDSVFYICVGISAWICHKQLFKGFEIPFLFLASFQLISWLFSLLKFKKLTSYHSYLAKFWGITLFITTISIFAFNYGGWTLWLTLGAGTISIVEDIIITLILPSWKVDILSIKKALEIKQNN